MREFFPGDRPQRFKRAENADAAVKHAGVRHGVDMRTGNDGIAVFRSGQNAEDIADRIDLQIQPRFLDPFTEQIARRLIAIAEGKAIAQAVRPDADLSEFFER